MKNNNSQKNITTQTKRFQIITERETQILKLIAFEHSDKEIGEKLFLSHHTIHTYRKNLMEKFAVRKSVGLIRKAFEMGIFS